MTKTIFISLLDYSKRTNILRRTYCEYCVNKHFCMHDTKIEVELHKSVKQVYSSAKVSVRGQPFKNVLKLNY